jgi:hypothetical protein
LGLLILAGPELPAKIGTPNWSPTYADNRSNATITVEETSGEGVRGDGRLSTHVRPFLRLVSRRLAHII